MKFDLNENSIPVNSVAAKVVYSKGFSEEYVYKGQGNCFSKTPFPTIKPKKKDLNLIGAKNGFLTVVGLFDNPKVKTKHTKDGKKKKKPGSWSCRCSCGNYVLRKAKSIRNRENFGDRCEECREFAFQRKEDERKSTGKELDIRRII